MVIAVGHCTVPARGGIQAGVGNISTYNELNDLPVWAGLLWIRAHLLSAMIRDNGTIA